MGWVCDTVAWMTASPSPMLTAATRRFEAQLAWYGEAVCIASLPLVIEEVAAEEADGDETIEAEITARLRHRAGLRA